MTPTLRLHAGPDAFDAPVRDLLDVLTLTQEQTRELLALSDRKLAALRRADATGLRECARQEEAALARVQETTAARRAVLARLAQLVREPSLVSASVSELADRLPEPLGSALRARSVPLRELALQLAERNQLAARVARNLHQHIRAVFTTLAEPEHDAALYGRNGETATAPSRGWIDATG